MVTELTAENFRKATSGKPVIVDFWAPWCGPCKMLAPFFEELSQDYQGKLEFAKLSTEDYPDIAAGQGITSIPCLIVFKGGKEVDRIIGLLPKEQLKKKIDAILRRT